MNKEKIKIIIVDDHELFRDGVKIVVSQLEGFEILAEASDGKEFLDILNVLVPDIVIMDISMPRLNGCQATKLALEKYPDLKIIALSMYGEEEYYFKMIEAGAKAFILKKSGKHEVETAIMEVAKGNNYFSQDLLKKMVLKINNKEIDNRIHLTDREKEVLDLICNGLTNKEMGEKLFLSPKTIDRHRTSLLSKTNTKNTAQLVMFAIKHKLIEI